MRKTLVLCLMLAACGQYEGNCLNRHVSVNHANQAVIDRGNGIFDITGNPVEYRALGVTFPVTNPNMDYPGSPSMREFHCSLED